MTEDIFGPLISTWDVEEAALSVLREWMPVYLSAVERKHDLPNGFLERPAAPECYYGGIDFQSEVAGLDPPWVIVTVEPEGRPEATSTAYSQSYNLQVASVVIGESERDARMRASLYGAATYVLAHHGGLNGLAEWTKLIGVSKPEWVVQEDSERRMMRCVTTYAVHVPNVVQLVGPSGETIAASEPELVPTAPEATPRTRPVVATEHLTIVEEKP